MKSRILSIVMAMLIFFQSCVSTQVSAKNKFNYSKLEVGKKYIVVKTNKTKVRAFTLTKIKDDKLIGTVEDKTVEVEKADIEKVNKVSVGKTIVLVVGSILLGVVGGAYMNQKPVGQ